MNANVSKTHETILLPVHSLVSILIKKVHRKETEGEKKEGETRRKVSVKTPARSEQKGLK